MFHSDEPHNSDKLLTPERLVKPRGYMSHRLYGHPDIDTIYPKSHGLATRLS
jgi:hypothetical protein